MLVIQNKRTDIRPGYLQDTKVSVFYGFFVLRVKVKTQVAACQTRDISVGVVNSIRAEYPRNLRSIPNRATEISFIHTVHTGSPPKRLLKAQVESLIHNLLRFCERASSGCMGRSSLHIQSVRLDGCPV